MKHKVTVGRRIRSKKNSQKKEGKKRGKKGIRVIKTKEVAFSAKVAMSLEWTRFLRVRSCCHCCLRPTKEAQQLCVSPATAMFGSCTGGDGLCGPRCGFRHARPLVSTNSPHPDQLLTSISCFVSRGQREWRASVYGFKGIGLECRV